MQLAHRRAQGRVAGGGSVPVPDQELHADLGLPAVHRGGRDSLHLVVPDVAVVGGAHPVDLHLVNEGAAREVRVEGGQAEAAVQRKAPVPTGCVSS